jgi:hypothetical protein
MGALELISDRYPPLAQIATAAKGVCILVANFKKCHFLFGR